MKSVFSFWFVGNNRWTVGAEYLKCSVEIR
jgi:hypothetical protein